MTPRAIGALAALAVLVADQASKLWLLDGLKMVDHERIVVTPFLDIYLVWNTGISYSLFTQSTEAGRWTLLAITAAATLLLGIWLWRVASRRVALGLGAIIGGALGNGVDRLAHGAVVDFFDFHLLGWSFYVFNLADTAITFGVVILAIDGLLADRGARKQEPA
jgi:signal peptidase II